MRCAGFSCQLNLVSKVVRLALDGQNSVCHVARPMQDTMPTIAEVRSLIENRPRSIELEQVAKIAGASVSWVKQFVAGKIKKPDYNKVVAVYQFLKPSEIH